MQRYLREVHGAIAQSAARYRAALARRAAAAAASTTAATPAIGSLVFLLRPRATKLICSNSGPYLLVALRNTTAVLRNLATGVLLEEHVSNIRPLTLPSIHLLSGMSPTLPFSSPPATTPSSGPAGAGPLALGIC